MTTPEIEDTTVQVSGITGRAWVFPQAYVNTDAIMPRMGYDLPTEEQNALILSTLRPGWAAQVRKGDLLVGGRNFGSGSSRPAVTLLTRIGIAGLVCESVAEVFFRNCVSYAMPVLECKGVLDLVEEGDTISLDIATGEVANVSKDTKGHGAPMPQLLLDTIAAGGAYAQLRHEGYM